MAAKAPPWPLLLFLSFFIIIIIIPFSQSSSSSSSPQNIQTFYPSPSPSQTKHIPPWQQENNTHPPSPILRRKVIKAVVATAISTFFVSALFFFLLIKYTHNKNNKQNPNPDSNPAINNNNTSAVQGDDDYDDGDGLDTLYWNKLKGGKFINTSNKHLVCNTVLPLQERPLLSDTETLPLSPPIIPPSPPPVPPAPKIPTPPPPMKGPAARLKPLPPPKREFSSSTQSSKIFILDPRKSQNISIVIRSLPLSRGEISDSLINGHGLNIETLERLTRITPTQEEQSAILEFTGDLENLADAESFLYHLLKSVPTAFSRLNSMLFRSNYEPETLYLKESLQTLEKACNDLKTRRIFLKLLEAILKAGNRMNAGTRRGNAQAFNLTALRKLSDVKSSDGKTTLLYFIVTEVIRAEGKRCLVNNQDSNQDKEGEYIIMGLPVVGGLSAELGSVKKAAAIEFDELAKTCPVLKARISEIREMVRENEDSESDGFSKEMRNFLESAEEELSRLKEEQEKVMEIVKKTTDYYHGNEGNNNPLQLFVVIRDFLGMVDQTCIDITRNMQKRRISGANDTGESSLARRTVQFPQLPSNFMSDKLNDSCESDEGEDP